MSGIERIKELDRMGEELERMKKLEKDRDPSYESPGEAFVRENIDMDKLAKKLWDILDKDREETPSIMDITRRFC